jgi:hypothetical protein
LPDDTSSQIQYLDQSAIVSGQPACTVVQDLVAPPLESIGQDLSVLGSEDSILVEDRGGFFQQRQAISGIRVREADKFRKCFQ